MIVLDASVVVDFLLDLDGRGVTAARRVLRSWKDLAAPHLLDAEVLHALRGLNRAGHLSSAQLAQAVDAFKLLPFRRFPHTPLLSRALEFRHNATAYDALYLALAEALEGTLVTRDRRLAGVPGVHATVEVLP